MINEVTFNSVNLWEELGAGLSAPVAYPIPAETKENVIVKGANGSLTESTGYFGNLELKLKFKALYCRAKEEYREFNSFKRRINIIFNNITDTSLGFSDVPDRYYKVKSCTLGAVEKKSDYEATFEVSFTCDPFLYNPKDLPLHEQGDNIWYNGDIPNKPIVRIEASGGGTATVHCNGQDLSFTIEDGGVIEINNNPYSIVTLDGKPIKSVGNPPVLKPGRNRLVTDTSFSWIGTIEIIKRERYLG